MAVVKIVELIGSSTKGWEDATKNALAEAAKTIKEHQVNLREALQCKSRKQRLLNTGLWSKSLSS